MHLGLFRREHLQSADAQMIGSAAVDQFQRTHGALEAWSEVEHTDDGHHTDIHATSVDVRPGGITAKGSGIFSGDVQALAGTGQDCGLGLLATVNQVPLLPNEPARVGMLLGGPLTGMFAEWRAAQAPYTSGMELAFWNLGIAGTGTTRPMFRIGLMSGVPALLDGGSGVSMDLGDLVEPIRTLYAQTVRAVAGGSAAFTYDSTRDAAAFDKNLVPITTGAQDLGWTNGLTWQRWRTLFLSAGIQEYGRAYLQGVPQSVPYSAGLFSTYGGVAWTVEAGDYIGYTYSVIGKTCIIQINLQNTSVAAGAGVFLIIQNPSGIVWASTVPTMPMSSSNDAGTPVRGYFNIIDGNRIGCVKFDASNWNAAANNTTIIGTMIGAIV